MFTIQQAKSNFFDRAKVQSAMDRTTRRNQSRFGAFVRTRARSSIRRRKGYSQPGSPPSAHASGPYSLRGSIFFAYDPGTRGVIIGPTLFSNSRPSPTVPELHEHSGAVLIRQRRRRPKRAHYPARSFMRPAFEVEKRKLPALWRNSLR